MKKLYVIAILFCCINGVVNAQAPNWEWAESTGDTGWSVGNRICAATKGHVYVTGTFTGNVAFGSDTLRGAGGFVAKYDSMGAVLWAKGFVSGEGLGLFTDAMDNVYITGEYFDSILVFGNDTLRNNFLSYNGFSNNIFVAKFDASGNIVWAKNAQAYNPNYFGAQGNSISVDTRGNVYITGVFWGPAIVFGKDTVTNADSVGRNVLFITKFDPSGKVIWATTAADTSSIYPFETDGGNYETANSISTDVEGNFYITGNFTSATITFADYFFLNSSYYYVQTQNEYSFSPNLFLVKYDSSGKVLWAIQGGGNNGSSGSIVSVGSNGLIYLSGNFADSACPIGNTFLTGRPGGFIAKINPQAAIIWTKSVTINNHLTYEGNGLSTDTNGNVYITGNLGIENSTENIFVAKYDESGDMIWEKEAGGTEDFSNGLGCDALGNVYITGYLVPSLNDSIMVFGNDTLVTNQRTDKIFIAKIDTMLSTGISGLTKSIDEITVYPNPSTGKLCFSGVNIGAAIQIFNVLGETIFSSIAYNSNYWLALNSQAKGIYFYRVTKNSGFIQTGKIVLE